VRQELDIDRERCPDGDVVDFFRLVHLLELRLMDWSAAI